MRKMLLIGGLVAAASLLSGCMIISCEDHHVVTPTVCHLRSALRRRGSRAGPALSSRDPTGTATTITGDAGESLRVHVTK